MASGLHIADIRSAQQLDDQDDLAGYRERFVITDPNTIYLDGNSLGRLPKATIDRMSNTLEKEWGDRLIRGWNEGWIHAPTALGAKIAQLIGARADEVLVSDSTSVNLFKLAVAALRARPGRPQIISDEFNFPSDLYIFQGIIDLLGKGHRLDLLPSSNGVEIDIGRLADLLGQETALVALTHVAFKSAYMYNMRQVTRQAHDAGALVLWDLCHSVGAVPLDLNGCDVDLAVGCTYKYLNSGPGAPAFLYVRRDLQSQLIQPIWGWFAAAKPFDFELTFEPASDIQRFRSGSIPVLATKVIEPAVALLLEVGMDRLREKSIRQTDYLIKLADHWLVPLGFRLGSPRLPEIRGSHVSLRHPEGYRITRALIESQPPAIRVIPDFRAPDNIRLGIAPIYTSFSDIFRALERIRQIVLEREYERFPTEKLAVT